MVGVARRVERGQLVAEHQPVAVLLDDVADVVTFERDRPLGERSRDGVARREGRVVVVDRRRLLEAGDHDDTAVRLAPDRAVRPRRTRSRGTGPARRPEHAGSRSRRSREWSPVLQSRRVSGRGGRARRRARRPRPRPPDRGRAPNTLEQRDQDDGVDVDVAEATRAQPARHAPPAPVEDRCRLGTELRGLATRHRARRASFAPRSCARRDSG